jgi:hypothetical protein
MFLNCLDLLHFSCQIKITPKGKHIGIWEQFYMYRFNMGDKTLMKNARIKTTRFNQN